MQGHRISLYSRIILYVHAKKVFVADDHDMIMMILMLGTAWD